MVDDTAFDEAKIDEIADSPQLWWGVQRKIKAHEEPLSPWNAGLLRRWLIVGAPLAVAALVLSAFFVSNSIEKPIEQGTTTPSQKSNEIANTDSKDKAFDIPSPEQIATRSAGTVNKSKNLVKKAVFENKGPRPQQPKTTATAAKSDPIEVKSEFIALSYARNPDSGQIVRVKVPSSMMVSLGLVASVEKPTNLVNAEILIGDDGMTHAIRFIR